MNSLLKQEVSELTSMLRCDPMLQGLRDACLERGLDPQKSYLLGFIESEDEEEFGILAGHDHSLFEYERSTSLPAGGFNKWERVSDVNVAAAKYPAVLTGIAMIKQGEI